MAVNLPVQNFFRRANTPAKWVRPADWPVITDTAGEVQFLMSDQGDSNCILRTNFTRTSGSQDMVIDWGDGTTTTITSIGTTNTPKTYTVGSGTPCSLGYTTFKIRVYFTGTGVSTITLCDIKPFYITGNTFSTQAVALLEAYYGDGIALNNPPNFYGSAGTSSAGGFYTYLKYVKFPATVTWSSLSQLFFGCSSLARVKMPSSASSIQDCNSTFQNCFLLEEVTFPTNAVSINSLSSAFSSCANLTSVTFPTSLNACSSLNNSFQNCLNIRNITLPSLNTCIGFTSTFTSCVQLEWVRFTSLYSGATNTINFTNTFTSCANLQNVYFPATVGSTSSPYTFSSTFQSCTSLKTMVFPSNMNVGTFGSAFSNCTSLISCILPNSTPACTGLQSAFSSCSNLTKVVLPTTVGGSVNLSSIFTSCFKLEEVTIPSSYNPTTLASAFQNCYSLKTLNWAPTTANSVSSLANAFSSCLSLTNITLPSSMTSVNTLSAAFNGCRSLRTVTFPTALNAVTTIASIFGNCTSLVSVTFPTSMSSCNNFSSSFNSCPSLESVVFPQTVAASTSTFNGAFFNCSSLRTVTFPSTAQLSNVTDCNSIFYGCSNLTTLVNFDKIGSLTAAPLMGFDSNSYARLINISIVAPLLKLAVSGASLASGRNDVQSLRLLNTGTGQWTGTSPQIDVSFTNMSTANLIQLFNDMAAQGNVTSKTINITSAVGVGGLTTTDRQIITTRGWTITG